MTILYYIIHTHPHTHTYTRIYVDIFIYECDSIIHISYTNCKSTCVPIYLHCTPGIPYITHTTRKYTSETDTTHLIINYVYNFGDAGHLAFLQGPTPQSDNPERLIFS